VTDRPESRRFLGFAWGEEVRPARSVGGLPLPAGQFGPVDRAWFAAVLHPLRSWRRARRRRRLGPYDIEE